MNINLRISLKKFFIKFISGFLKEELRETHNDYREELARITQQVNLLKDDEGTSTVIFILFIIN